MQDKSSKMEKETGVFVETFGRKSTSQDGFIILQSSDSSFDRQVEPYLLDIMPNVGDTIMLHDFFPGFQISKMPTAANVREVVFYKNRIEIIIWV